MNGIVSGGRPNRSKASRASTAAIIASNGAQAERCTWLTASAASAGL